MDSADARPADWQEVRAQARTLKSDTARLVRAVHDLVTNDGEYTVREVLADTAVFVAGIAAIEMALLAVRLWSE